VDGFMDYANRTPVTMDTEYYAFKVSVLPRRSTGRSACTGCAAPLTITLRQIQLYQAPELEYDPLITTPLDRNTIRWQGSLGPETSSLAFAPRGRAPATSVTIRCRTV